MSLTTVRYSCGHILTTSGSASGAPATCSCGKGTKQ